MKISTSILGAKDRVECVTKLNKTNTSYIHIDVMDGEFVNNTQFNNFKEVNSINMVTKYPMDIHLMVNNPFSYVIQYRDMNIEYITFHVEIKEDKDRVIEEIKKMGYKVGLSIKPNTDIKKLEKYLDKIDMILIMSVEPGLGGQEFIEDTVDRIKKVRELIGDRDILIEVDGGINDKTISKICDVDIVVVGSYITSSDDYNGKIKLVLKNAFLKADKDDDKVEKGKKKWKILLFICLIVVLIRAMYNSIVGVKFFYLDGGGSSSFKGLFVFVMTIWFWMFILLWIVGLLLVIINIINGITGKRK